MYLLEYRNVRVNNQSWGSIIFYGFGIKVFSQKDRALVYDKVSHLLFESRKLGFSTSRVLLLVVDSVDVRNPEGVTVFS